MDFNAYLSNPVAIDAQNRASAAWNRIMQKPTTIAFKNKAGTVLDSQVVRIEYDNRASEASSEAGTAPLRKLTIFGVVDHGLIDDTDIGEGYRFVYLGDEYRVIDTMLTIGEIQASCEAVG